MSEFREKTVGASLYSNNMEVAFEQWTERDLSSVGFNGDFHRYRESSIDISVICIRTDRVQKVISEFRW